jgi:hypothetical protein
VSGAAVPREGRRPFGTDILRTVRQLSVRLCGPSSSRPPAPVLTCRCLSHTAIRRSQAIARSMSSRRRSSSRSSRSTFDNVLAPVMRIPDGRLGSQAAGWRHVSQDTRRRSSARLSQHLGGDYTALAAVIVGSSGRVVAIEIDEELAARARRNLSTLSHVTARPGDAVTYAPDPCDAILVNAGFTHPLPLLWVPEILAQ